MSATSAGAAVRSPEGVSIWNLEVPLASTQASVISQAQRWWWWWWWGSA